MTYETTRHVVVLRIIGGDIIEQATLGYSSYKWALRATLQRLGLRLSQVVICR